MRKTKFPSDMKGGKKCKSCGAIVIRSYDNLAELYRWVCQGCHAIRYESGAKFEARFPTADKL